MIEKQSSKIKGGKREGAGRKAGVRNKKTQALLESVEETGITPLEYMLKVMRSEEEELKTRLNAAIAAAPYVHAKLSSIELSGKDGSAIETVSRIELVALE